MLEQKNVILSLAEGSLAKSNESMKRECNQLRVQLKEMNDNLSIKMEEEVMKKSQTVISKVIEECCKSIKSASVDKQDLINKLLQSSYLHIKDKEDRVHDVDAIKQKTEIEMLLLKEIFFNTFDYIAQDIKVCMYVCVYVCMHVCMYVCIHVRMCVCLILHFPP